MLVTAFISLKFYRSIMSVELSKLLNPLAMGQMAAKKGYLDPFQLAVLSKYLNALEV